MNVATAAAHARQQLNSHGLHDWGVVWSSDIENAGYCDYEHRAIRFSLPIVQALPPEYEGLFHELVIHEIAHAWTPDREHDEIWQLTVRLLGGNPRANIPILFPVDKGATTAVT